MSFYVNIGYRFSIPDSVSPDGSIILCSAMAYHQLERRRIDDKYPHLQNRLFDPQLYLAGLDAAESGDHCLKLATYPWFGVSGLRTYDSSQQTQAQWKASAGRRIASIWPRTHPMDLDVIRHAVRDCIDFQNRFGCQAIILPSPLTVDPGTNYQDELCWLDTALEYIASASNLDLPVFATVAISEYPPGELHLDGYRERDYFLNFSFRLCSRQAFQLAGSRSVIPDKPG